MFNIFKRFSEPSSYAGLAAILFGIQSLFKVNELQGVPEAVQAAGEAVATTGSPVTGIGALVLGLAALFLPETKKE